MLLFLSSVLSAIDTESCIDVPLVQGWQTISFHCGDLSFDILDSASFGQDDKVFSRKGGQLLFATFDGAKWQGSLVETGFRPFAFAQGYKVYFSGPAASALKQSGEPQSPVEGIVLSKGWNWVGFPLFENYDINMAVVGKFSIDDSFKTRSGNTLLTSTFDGSKFVGSLSELKPGVGYEVLVAQAVRFRYTRPVQINENPVYKSGLAARQNAEISFVASLENYVPPGSGYERTVYNNGTHDLCPYLFSKTLEHDPVTSFPLCSHVQKIVEAVSTPPRAEMFTAIPRAPGSVQKLEGPQTSWDSMLMTSPAATSATAKKLTDPEFGFEIAEVFAMALLRDKPFVSWAQDAEVQQVIDVLNTYSQKSTAPLEGGVITLRSLMRGAGADETIGPYVSQYLLQPFQYGNLKITQKYAIENDPHEPTAWKEFIKIQDGRPTETRADKDGESFNFSPRILGSAVHNDPLFQFYYNAALISFQCGISASGMTGDAPPSTISAWTQGGGPDVFGTVSGVALSALKAGWWHKWQHAMRIRPEAVGGLFEFCKNNLAKCERVPELRPMYDAFRQGLKNMTLAFTGRTGGSETLLLATQYPEGSPTHPSWPAGHATVAGACVTILKAMLNTHNANNEKLPWPTEQCTAFEAHAQGELSSYAGADAGDMTIVGELNKLASNAALGRNFAGVHFRSDGDQGLVIGEQIAIQYLESKLQEYALKSVLNSFTLEKFDGTIIVITG